MKLVRFRLKLLGTWASPWRADSLTGLLASRFALSEGSEALQDQLLTPWANGQPPFVLSDAFPGNLFPAPAVLNFWPYPEERRKLLRRTEWLTQEQFTALQLGRSPDIPEPRLRPFARGLRMRNSLNRDDFSTARGGTLYAVPTTWLSGDVSTFLSLYGRVTEEGAPLLRRLLEELSFKGFGADAPIGEGQFELDGEESAGFLDDVSEPTGWVSLSAFQPTADDPVDGYWKSFTKYGRLGPEFGVDGVFKRPQWMLEPGACFATGGPPREWYGRLIPTEQILSARTAEELAARNIRPVQPAFALAVPMRWLPTYVVSEDHL